MGNELDANGNPIVQPADGGAPVGDPAPEDKIDKKEFEAVLKESLKRKDALAVLERQNLDLQKQFEQMKTQGMKTKEAWKELAETKEKEVDQLKSENTQIKKAVVDASKHMALKSAVLKLGLHPSGEKYLDTSTWLDEVEVEYTSTGRVNVLNAERVAQNFKTQNPLLFQAPSAPGINTNSPQVVGNGAGKVTIDQINALSKKYAETKNPKDAENYKNAIIAYKTQQ